MYVQLLLIFSQDKCETIAGKERVVSVFPSTAQKLLTTRSWDFLGMPEATTKRDLHTESNIIVALLDTGTPYSFLYTVVWCVSLYSTI